MRLAKRIGSLRDAIIDDSQSEVFYYQLDDNSPGVCVENGVGKLLWSPIKISRTCVKPASDSESSDVEPLKPPEIGSITFEIRHGVPGFEIETANDDDDDVFWIPVAHRTRSRLKS